MSTAVELCLIGVGLAGSKSPVLFETAARERGLEVRYELVEVAPLALDKWLHGARARPRLRGLSVTQPHKLAVALGLDALVDDARECSAVNVIARDGEKLIGLNTDVEGFGRALDRHGLEYANRRALVIGAGGAGRAVIVALRRRGLEVSVAARTPREVLGLVPTVLDRNAIESLTKQGAFDVIVNATGTDDPLAIALAESGATRSTLALDLRYRGEPAWLGHLKKKGARTEDGLSMLVEQAALAFERWFEEDAPRAAMYRAVGR